MSDIKLTPEVFEGVVDLFDRALYLAVSKSKMNRTCLSCAFFHEATESCTFYNPPARPPARVIVEACPAWKDGGGKPF